MSYELAIIALGILTLAVLGVEIMYTYMSQGFRYGFSANLLCSPTFCHRGQEFFVYSQHGGLVSPSEFASVIGGIFPIALCGRSSL